MSPRSPARSRKPGQRSGHLLRSEEEWSVLADVMLDEGDLTAAFDAYDRVGRQQETWPYGASYAVMSDTLEFRLARASARDYPDRAIALYRHEADRAIANRQRSAYTVAAGHLSQVKDILTEHGRAAEWPPIIDAVRTTNKSLRALREELDRLDLR